MFFRRYFFICLMVYNSHLVAEVVLDGTLGPEKVLEGPDFEILSEYGRQEGNNLFHSFSQFDLNKEQSATFTGDETIQNIIGRVTSGKYSIIDGTLRTQIPRVDLYLVNPGGFIFGPNAKLDLQGSIHLSTAHQIKLGSQGVFNAAPSQENHLVSVPPSAFGFLGGPPAKISIQQSQIGTGQGKTFSLIGGEIDINAARLRAISGQVNLVSIGSTPAEIQKDFTKPSTGQFGKIVIENQSSIDVGKEGAGDIYIRSGELILSNSDIIANTSASKNGGVIKLEVEELRLSASSSIDSRTFGPGQGGQIILKVSGTAMLSEGSIIQSSTLSSDPQAGNAGNIILEAQCLNLEGGTISSATKGKGQGGDINISVAEKISLISSSDFPSIIEASSEPQQGKENQAGNAGRIYLQAQDLHLSGSGGKIDNSTLGSGLGGNITINVLNKLTLSDQAFISADSKGMGEAGNITLNAKELVLHAGTISTATDQARGGNIIINTRQSVQVQEGQISATVSGGHGNGGNLLISNPRFFHLVNSKVIANAKAGHGGLVLIVTVPPIISENSSITASSEAGLEGEVKIDDLYNVDLSNLPILFLDASGLIRKRCVAKTVTDLSSFIMVGREGISRAPDDLQPYTLQKMIGNKK